MYSRDYRDLIAGLALTAFGLWMLWYATTHYNLGTLRRMGPGMFPAGLGAILAAFGVLVTLPALFRRGGKMDISWYTMLCISAGVAGFALLIKPAGLFPAIIAVVVLSSLAERNFRPVSLAGLCAVLCLLAWLVFRVALGLPMTMLVWPF